MELEPTSGVLLLARVVLAVLFVHAGWGKIFEIERFAAAMAAKGMPVPALFPYLGILIEFCGGIVLLLGLRPRLLGVLFAICTLAKALIGHDFWMYENPAQ